MRKGKVYLLILIGVMMSILFGCGRNERPAKQQKPEDGISVSVTNKIKEADIWIIPDTEGNRKTTVWGTATLSKLVAGEGKEAYIEASPKYLVRMIDKDQMFYSADEIELAAGWSVVIIEGTDSMSATVQIYDEKGNLTAEYSMFVARL